MLTKKKILLTGASGFIGSELLHQFLAEGHEVIALVRNIPDKKIKGVTFFRFDMNAPSLKELTTPVDILVHAAYVKQTKGNDAFKINMNAARYLLERARALGADSFVFLSSLSAAHDADSVYGKQKFEIENIFLAENGTAIQPGLVLGNGGLFASMRTYLQKKSIIPLFGDGQQPVQTIHIDDLTKGMTKIISENRKGKFVLAEDEPVAYKLFYTELCRTLHVKPKFIKAGFRLSEFMIGVAEKMGLELPITSENLRGLRGMRHVPSGNDLDRLELKVRTWKESLSSLQ